MSGEANVVYVGRKPLMNYVLARVTSFNASNAEKVVLKATGASDRNCCGCCRDIQAKFP